MAVAVVEAKGWRSRWWTRWLMRWDRLVNWVVEVDKDWVVDKLDKLDKLWISWISWIGWWIRWRWQ